MIADVKEFNDNTKLMEEVNNLSAQDVNMDDLFVISYDSVRDSKFVGNVDDSTFEAYEEVLSNLEKNIYRQESDELRAKFKELGFDQAKIKELENKLAKGKLLLIHRK